MLTATDETRLHFLVSLWAAGAAARPEKLLLQKHLLVPGNGRSTHICGDVGTWPFFTRSVCSSPAAILKMMWFGCSLVWVSPGGGGRHGTCVRDGGDEQTWVRMLTLASPPRAVDGRERTSASGRLPEHSPAFTSLDHVWVLSSVPVGNPDF